LEVEHPLEAVPERNASGEVIQCGARKVRVVLVVRVTQEEKAQPAATAQRGQPSVFGRFVCIRNSILARPAWLI